MSTAETLTKRTLFAVFGRFAVLHKCTGEPPEAPGKEHPISAGSNISTKKKKHISYLSR